MGMDAPGDTPSIVDGKAWDGGPIDDGDEIDGQPAGLDRRYNCKGCNGTGRVGNVGSRWDCQDCNGLSIDPSVAMNPYILRARLQVANRRTDGFEMTTGELTRLSESRGETIDRLNREAEQRRAIYGLWTVANATSRRMRHQRDRWHGQAMVNVDDIDALARLVETLISSGSSEHDLLNLYGRINLLRDNLSDALYGAPDDQDDDS